VATLTSTISLTEVVIAYLVEEAGLSRNKATIINAIGVIVMATLSSLSFGSLSGFTICGLTFFNLLDFISSNIMLPLGGLLICIYAGWFLDKKILKRQLTNSDSEPRPLVKVVIFLLRYVAPLAILTIFVAGLL
jgi:NSS family neurotransmitter:Na+ symporter